MLLEAGIVADRLRLGTLEGVMLANVADLDALALLLASSAEGRIIHVDELGANFQAQDGAWVQITEARFASAATRDTAYAKAAAAYRVQGARSYLTGNPRYEYVYLDLYNSGSNPDGAAAAGWYVADRSPEFRIEHGPTSDTVVVSGTGAASVVKGNFWNATPTISDAEYFTWNRANGTITVLKACTIDAVGGVLIPGSAGVAYNMQLSRNVDGFDATGVNALDQDSGVTTAAVNDFPKVHLRGVAVAANDVLRLAVAPGGSMTLGAVVAGRTGGFIHVRVVGVAKN